MPQTSNSSSSAYCSPEQFFTFYAPQLAADVLRAAPDAPRPSYLAMLDSANPAGAKLLTFLGKGAGEIEAACLVSSRYQPPDLLALTGVSLELLHGLNAARTMWALYQRLKPGSADPKQCPGAIESEALLDALRDNKRIFSFEETQAAGLPSINQASPGALLTPNVVGRAYRLFPQYGPNRLSGQGN
jgi:hypothetical protein